MSRTIVVTRSVHAAAEVLLQKTTPDDEGTVFSLADDRLDECHAAGDQAGVALWHDVWMYLTAKLIPDSVVRIIEDAP